MRVILKRRKHGLLPAELTMDQVTVTITEEQYDLAVEAFKAQENNMWPVPSWRGGGNIDMVVVPNAPDDLITRLGEIA